MAISTRTVWRSFSKNSVIGRYYFIRKYTLNVSLPHCLFSLHNFPVHFSALFCHPRCLRKITHRKVFAVEKNIKTPEKLYFKNFSCLPSHHTVDSTYFSSSSFVDCEMCALNKKYKKKFKDTSLITRALLTFLLPLLILTFFYRITVRIQIH